MKICGVLFIMRCCFFHWCAFANPVIQCSKQFLLLLLKVPAGVVANVLIDVFKYHLIGTYFYLALSKFVGLCKHVMIIW